MLKIKILWEYNFKREGNSKQLDEEDTPRVSLTARPRVKLTS